MANTFSHTFLMRKLHQLTGIVPLGAFFVVHMFTNSKAMLGQDEFNKAVEQIHSIPYLLLIEVFGIFLPLLFHSVYGIVISKEARNNVLNYSYGRNWLYVLQRVTGIFLFFFILFHILSLRFGFFGVESVAGNAANAYQIVSGELASVGILALYIAGVVATSWHLAYGIFLFAVDWGLVIGTKAQSYVLKGCVGVAILLSAIGINAALRFKDGEASCACPTTGVTKAEPASVGADSSK
jgi:succinate dehydrogenase / fumarate reductase, cytochrome b subunit